MDSAARKLAMSSRSAVMSLQKEMMGTGEQFKALEALEVQTSIHK